MENILASLNAITHIFMNTVTISDLLFVAFSVLLLASALMVITIQHPVKAALFLVLAFFAATGLWLLLTAEFLALILILVYVGAVMTLFLFVVMTLNIDPATLRQPYLKFYIPLGLFFTALLTAILLFALSHTASPFIIYAKNLSSLNISNVTELGNQLYTSYALPFEITGVLLLVAIIAAISLSLSVPLSSKHQAIDEQLRAKKHDRIRTVR